MTSSPLKQALVWVVNTEGSATKSNFLDDFEPIGGTLWEDLKAAEAIKVEEGKVFITEQGKALLEKLS
jgi:predicted methyltransferase